MKFSKILWKRVLLSILFLTTFLFLLSLIHFNLLGSEESLQLVSLTSSYMFHIVMSSVVLLIMGFVALNYEIYLGYGYMTSVFIKPFFLVVVFKDVILSEGSLGMMDKLLLLVPFFCALLAEVISIHGILKLVEKKQKIEANKVL